MKVAVQLLFFLILFCFSSEAQYKRWSLDTHIGISNALRPFAPEYGSNYMGMFHFDFGGRYMATNKFGVRLDVGFDRIKNDETGHIQGPLDSTGAYTFVKSKPFETHYFRISIQGVFDLGRVFEFDKLHKNLSLLGHLGFGFSSLKDKKNSVWFKNWRHQGSDEMMNLIIGLTPQWKVNDDWAFHLDFTMVGNAWQSKTWDFTENNFEKGIHGRLMNLSLGATIYLGKSDKHLDWVYDMKSYEGARFVDTIRTTETIRTINPVKAGATGDTDGDGVADLDDDCPSVYGAGQNGCPEQDSDKDGIADENDRCPNKPGIPENLGCPELDLYVKKVLNEAMIDVDFSPGTDVLKENSKVILDKIVKVLNEYPEFYMDIEGHTSNAGRSEPNQVLSEKRSLKVYEYIVSKGIDETRLESFGYGDTKPVASNNDPGGREQNERIEFNVRYE